MKTYFYTSLLFSMFAGIAFGQCPKDGLAIQSDACEYPKNLKATSLNCTELNMQWNGIPGQAYRVKAVSQDPIARMITETEEVVVTADANGNCATLLQVKEGRHVSWMVQAVCMSDNSSLYSAEVKGKDTDILLCPVQKETASNNQTIAIYPNPSKNYLTVEYTGTGGGSVVFDIFNTSGNKVLSQVETTQINVKMTYTLNIRQLPPGMYLLKTTNKKDGTGQAKFVKVNM